MPKEETFPIPLKYTDVARSTHTDLDVMQEKGIDDFWNVIELKHVRFEEKFHKIQFIKRKTSQGQIWSGERLTKVQTTTRPDHVWPDVWSKIGKAAQDREKTRIEKKTRSQNSTMLDDWEETALKIRMTKNTGKPYKIRGWNWKGLWTRPCRAKRRFILAPGNW